MVVHRQGRRELYPQAKASPFLPFNPNACWDWWSYIDHDDGYVTKAGLQIVAIKSMLDALTAGGRRLRIDN